MSKNNFIDEAEWLLKSESWKERYNATDLIKSDKITARETDELSFVFGLIKKGLKDKDGRVRNNSVYAFKDFRCGLSFSPSYVGIEVFRELYNYASDEKDAKIKKGFLRCLNYMKCIDLEFKFRDMGCFKEYKEITDFLEKEVGDKYDIKYPRNSELHKKLDKVVRQMCILGRLNPIGQEPNVDESVRKIWKENEDIAKSLGDAYYDSILEESEELIEKYDKENVGYNMFVDGIRVGLDIVVPLLNEEMQDKVKDKIEGMLEKRAMAEDSEEEFWSEGGFIKSINPNDPDYAEKKKYIEEKADEKKEHNCKKCNKPIGKHNLYWHEGMCNECFFNEYNL